MNWRLFSSLALIAAVFAPAAHGIDPAEPTPAAQEKARLQRGVLLAPKAFRAAAAKVAPSLVTIEGFGGVMVGGDARGIQAPGVGPTTGVVISSDGYIVTSTFNFLRKPPIITVQLATGERKVAKLLGRDETRKLCLLKIEGVSNLPTAELAPRDRLRVGQWVVALGIGFGDPAAALTAGVISATSRIGGKAVQTDANLSPANYGGPLVDLDGRLVGICVPLSPQSQAEGAGNEWYDSGIGFAVPLHGNDKVLAALKEGQILQKGFLGVQTQPTGSPPTGATIVQVVPGSAAEKAGLAKDDKILAIDGAEILDPTHMSSVVARYIAGDKIKLDVQRGMEKKSVEAELGVVPPPPAKPEKPAEPAVPDQPKKPKGEQDKPGTPEKPGSPDNPAPPPAEKPMM